MIPKIAAALVLAATPVVAKAGPAHAAQSRAVITIHAPAERVWDLVTGVDAWPRWNRAVTRAHLEGPLARGTVFRWKSGGFDIRSTFQDVTPTRRLSWTGETLGTRAVHSWTFEATPGGVVVTTTESFDGWLPALAPRMMQKTLDDTLPALLASLKAAAEARR